MIYIYIYVCLGIGTANFFPFSSLSLFILFFGDATLAGPSNGMSASVVVLDVIISVDVTRSLEESFTKVYETVWLRLTWDSIISSTLWLLLWLGSLLFVSLISSHKPYLIGLWCFLFGVFHVVVACVTLCGRVFYGFLISEVVLPSLGAIT